MADLASFCVSTTIFCRARPRRSRWPRVLLLRGHEAGHRAYAPAGRPCPPLFRITSFTAREKPRTPSPSPSAGGCDPPWLPLPDGSAAPAAERLSCARRCRSAHFQAVALNDVPPPLRPPHGPPPAPYGLPPLRFSVWRRSCSCPPATAHSSSRVRAAWRLGPSPDSCTFHRRQPPWPASLWPAGQGSVLTDALPAR